MRWALWLLAAVAVCWKCDAVPGVPRGREVASGSRFRFSSMRLAGADACQPDDPGSSSPTVTAWSRSSSWVTGLATASSETAR
jgi:hypothetical protein